MKSGIDAKPDYAPAGRHKLDHETTMFRKHPQLKRLATETSGQEIAEAAIVLPVAFLILMAIFWFGRAYNIYATVTHAAAEGARIAATSTCANCTDAVATNTTVQNTVTAVLQASRLDPNRIGIYTPTPAPVFCPGLTPPGACTTTANNVTVCRGIELNDPAISSPQACGTRVSFQYPYQFIVFNFKIVNLPASAEARVED
jgi:Flp pilus assembly protein TadG